MGLGRTSSCCSLLLVSLLAALELSAAEAYAASAVSACQSRLWKQPIPKVLTANLHLSRAAIFTDKAMGIGTDEENLPPTRLGQTITTSRRFLIRLRSGASMQGANESNFFWNKKLFRELLAEFIGTGIIVGIGTGAVMSAIFDDALMGLFQIAAVWTIAVTIAIATTGPISGAHLNPAISISFAMLRPSQQFGWAKLVPYIVAQTAGAVCFSLVNLFLYASKIRSYEATNSIVRGTSASVASAKAFGQYYLEPVSTLTAFFVEALGTAFLSFVIFSLTHPKNDTIKKDVYIPPLIGATVGALISVLAPLTQAGFNPARDFGPRIVAWLSGWKSVAFQGWWLYVVAPIVGAPLGAWFADVVLYGTDEASLNKDAQECVES